MDKLKYVIFSIGKFEFPIIFPEILVHKNVASGIRGAAEFVEAKSVSAGFVSKKMDGTWEAYGRSESLNLDSRPIDGIIITEFFEV